MEDNINIVAREIECSYNNGKRVLYVENFYLKKGEIVFLLGPSGIGKSTFIEAIGLINKTARKVNPNGCIQYKSNSKIHDLITMWEDKNAEIETFRRDHFSFIFQNNYLMPNLTAGENMMMTLLMKGYTEEIAEKKIREYMEIVDLKNEVIGKNVYNLSGGQKQRLAFVRAIASPFDILIGDEPTGNLDVLTARSMMNFTRTSVKKNNKSGIFVSHDINLALDFADRIYLFVPQKDGDQYYGKVSDHHMYFRVNQKWMLNGTEVMSPYDEILSVFTEIV